MDQADRTGDTGAHPLARLAHGRVVAVDERDGRDAAGGGRGLGELLGAGLASIASGFSQITCLPAASAASASGR